MVTNNQRVLAALRGTETGIYRARIGNDPEWQLSLFHKFLGYTSEERSKRIESMDSHELPGVVLLNAPSTRPGVLSLLPSSLMRSGDLTVFTGTLHGHGSNSRGINTGRGFVLSIYPDGLGVIVIE